MSKYDIDKIRNKIRKTVGKGRDPNEFRPPKVDDGKTIKYRFYILPPIEQGAKVHNGHVMTESMENFFVRTGAHYINNKYLGCPRVINDESCSLCQYAFDLMGETEDKDERSNIAKQLLPPTYFKVNIYFTNSNNNPEELRGVVKYYNAPKTVFDKWWECLLRDDDGGDADDPEPFGVFFDEMEAYQFQLEVEKHGQNNSYKSSKFLTSVGKRPIIVDKEGKPIKKKIDIVLAQRFNLFDSLPKIETDELERITAELSGEESGGGFDQDESKDESKEKPKGSGKSKDKEKSKDKSKGGKGLKPNTKPKPNPEPESDDDDDDISGEVPVDDDVDDDAPVDSSDDDVDDDAPADSDDDNSDDDPADDDASDDDDSSDDSDDSSDDSSDDADDDDDGDDDGLDSEVEDLLSDLTDDDDDK